MSTPRPLDISLSSATGDERRWFALIVTLFAGLGFAYIWVIPPGFGPDEMAHSQTVRVLAEEHRMPVATNVTLGEGGAHAMHPPLYYALEVPIYLLSRGHGSQQAVAPGCIRAMRFLSLLLGGITLWQFYLLLRALFPSRPGLALGALAFVAFLPEYLLLSSTVLNDIAAVLCGILLLRALAEMAWSPKPLLCALYAGLAMAALANAKGQILMLLPLAAGWLIALALWRKLTWRQAALSAAIAYGLLLILGSAWYVRNWGLYGEILPPGLDQWAARAPDGHKLSAWEIYSTGAITPLLWRSVVGLWESLWSQVDWFLNPPPPGVAAPIPPIVPYGLLGLLCVLAVGGHLRAYLRRLGKPAAPEPDADDLWRRRVVWLAYAQFALLYAAVTYMAIFVHLGWYQGGRYLYPGVWGVGLFLGIGYLGLPPRAGRWLSFLAPVVLLLLNALCIYNLLFILNPAYAGG